MPESATVTLDELGGRLGGSTAEHATFWCDRAGVEVAVDWAGRFAVRPADAAAVVDVYDRTTSEHERHWRAYQRYLADRGAAAHAAGGDVFHATLDNHRATGVGDPQAHAAAMAAQNAAIEDYHRAHPELTFEQFKKKGSNL